MGMNWKNIYANLDGLRKHLFADNRMTVLQILKNSQENNRGGFRVYYSYRPCNFIKAGPHHGGFCENFPNFSE